MKMHEFLEKHPEFNVEILYIPQIQAYRIDVYDRLKYYTSDRRIKSFECTKDFLDAFKLDFDYAIGYLLDNWYTERTGGGAN